MLQRHPLRQALARAERLFHRRREHSTPAPQPPATAEVVPEETPPAPAPSPAGPLAPHHRTGLEMARAQRWNWAQRELEAAVRADPQGPAAADLASVRAARRQLRLLAKWPRDAQAYLALGRAYMELELGEAAEGAFQRAIALAPQEPAGYALLALEYTYRGALDEAERAYARARALTDELPPFADLLAEWRHAETERPCPPRGGSAQP